MSDRPMLMKPIAREIVDTIGRMEALKLLALKLVKHAENERRKQPNGRGRYGNVGTLTIAEVPKNGTIMRLSYKIHENLFEGAIIKRPHWKVTENGIRLADVPDTVLQSMQRPGETTSKYIDMAIHDDKPIRSAKRSGSGSYKVVIRLDDPETEEL